MLKRPIVSLKSYLKVVIITISKLQKAMGRSSLVVSLTYLRGLEVSELEEEDMPVM
jgi:hypothetical protein